METQISMQLVKNDDDLSWVLKYSGSKSLIIGTDYGHTDPSTQIDAISIFRNREDLDQYNKNNYSFK